MCLCLFSATQSCLNPPWFKLWGGWGMVTLPLPSSVLLSVNVSMLPVCAVLPAHFYRIGTYFSLEFAHRTSCFILIFLLLGTLMKAKQNRFCAWHIFVMLLTKALLSWIHSYYKETPSQIYVKNRIIQLQSWAKRKLLFSGGGSISCSVIWPLDSRFLTYCLSGFCRGTQKISPNAALLSNSNVTCCWQRGYK